MTTTAQKLDYRILDKKETAKLLGITTRTIDRMVADRKIPFLRIPTGIGNRQRTMFDTRDIDKWLESMRITPEEQAPTLSPREAALQLITSRR